MVSERDIPSVVRRFLENERGDPIDRDTLYRLIAVDIFPIPSALPVYVTVMCRRLVKRAVKDALSAMWVEGTVTRIGGLYVISE